MNTLKEKCQAVMLPSEKESNLHKIGDELGYTTVSRVNPFAKQQHLYILSNDKIKEGDWVYHNSGYISQVLGFNLDAIKLEDAQRWTKDCKKIIATTDSSLIIEKELDIHSIPTEYVEEDTILPQPSQEFIKKFVKKYNEGNPNTEVLVEYVKYIGGVVGNGWEEYRPKINTKNNTITIHPVKDRL
jgi:hypothetical protein